MGSTGWTPKIGLAAAIACLVIVLAAGTAMAQGSPGSTFTGTVTAAGASIPGGTRITAVIAGDRYSTHSPGGSEHSTYELTIQAPEGKSYADGTPVMFEVDGYQTTQTATFRAGGNVRLDLDTAVATAGESRAYSVQADGEASSNWLTIVVLCAGVLMIGAMGYYLKVLNRVNKRRLKANT